MATYEVSTFSRGCFGGTGGEESNLFISGSTATQGGWILFGFTTANINNAFQGVDPFVASVSETVSGYNAAGIGIVDNGDVPLNVEPTEVALLLKGLGSIFKSAFDGDFVRAVTAIPSLDRAAASTDYRVHEGTDVPEGIISETLPVLVLDANTHNERWTRDGVFAEQFGVYIQVTSGLGETDVAVGQMWVRITFIQIAPTVATAPAGRSGSSALITFGASVDPQEATLAFPIHLYFQYGTTTDETLWESTSGQDIVGSGVRLVYEDGPASIQPNTTYFYRAYGSYADGEVAASKIASFTTPSVNQIMKVF